MKFSLFAAPILLAAQAMAESLPLRVITFNIRYDAGSREDGEKPWDDWFCGIWESRCRRYKLVGKLEEISAAPADGATVIGLQEVLHNQLEDIMGGMGDPWSYIGVGRDDGKEDGEYTPILYRTDALKLVFSEVKWLSPTPDEVSFGWGAGSRRTVTLAVFEHIATGHRFMHVNTHLDNVSSEARSKGILVAVDRIKAAQATYGPLGVSLTGDFNSAPFGDAYNALKNTGYFTDIYYLAPDSAHVGTLGNTYTTFSPDAVTSRIDFIWLGNATDQPYTATKYEIIDNVVDDMYISDHRPVVGDLSLRV
ncbi:hypothetical protein TD95_002142 [Thielaviopsis punctulata]|uniref:Endonuclease/exonuclease/phosphatase domain-containing protein n=1 Tax=Thielaviopsis punctulata TaxID=72032 RepID=A0A0F4Z6I9_9PEZI|nr:hypothetical protein TD95_002142 [Thielaviopsis punctulata]